MVEVLRYFSVMAIMQAQEWEMLSASLVTLYGVSEEPRETKV